VKVVDSIILFKGKSKCHMTHPHELEIFTLIRESEKKERFILSILYKEFERLIFNLLKLI
jgi:hypothetical protein